MKTRQAFTVKSGTKLGCSLSHFSFVQRLKSSLKENTRKGDKGMQIKKKEIEISLFTDYMILCIKDPKDSTRKLL